MIVSITGAKREIAPASGKLGVLLPEHLPQLLRRPHVVRALDVLPAPVVTVGVQRGGEPALGGAQFTHHEVGGVESDPTSEPGTGGTPEVGVDAAQQRVVIEVVVTRDAAGVLEDLGCK